MIIGIDLGTTNSLVSIWKDGVSHLIANAHGSNLTPSVVSIDKSGSILVGQTARERLLSHPDVTVACFKRFMGTEKVLPLGKKNFRPEELSALVLKSLKRDAEAFLGEAVHEAVITVPAYFSDAQRKATKAAGQLAGLKVERLLNEPTAAALAYGLHEFQDDCKILVIDLGGGTFDVSILEKFDGVMEVRAIAGDNFLGGEDFVDALMDYCIETKAKAYAIPPRLKPHPAHIVLRREAERAKRVLTNHDVCQMQIPWNDAVIDWSLSRSEFEAVANPLLHRIRTPIERALRDANIHPEALHSIVLAGGATRMPMVKKLVTSLFRKLPTTHLNPDEVVARGAAVQAGLKMRDKALDEVVFTDVAPYSMGIETATRFSRDDFIPGTFAPIIERGTTIPVSRSENFHTMQDDQKQIRVAIYQGEARFVKDNIFLGSLEIEVPRDKAGMQEIDVRFTYDINGILEAQVKSLATGQEKRLVIEENPGVLTAAEIESRLKQLDQLKIHPRDQEENRYVLALAERLYAEYRGAVRTEIGDKIVAYQYILAQQNERDIKAFRDDFIKLLERLDRGHFS